MRSVSPSTRPNRWSYLLAVLLLTGPAARAQVQLPTSKAVKPPILRAAQPKSGVYFSFEQFVANRPDTTAQVQLDSVRGNTLRAKTLGRNTNTNGPGWEGTILLRAKVRTASGRTVPLQQVWGFASRGQAFVRQGNLYRPLTRLRDFYTYVGAAPIDYEATRQRAKSLAFGWGNAAAPGGTAGHPITGALPNTPDDDSGQPMVFAINMQTGYVAPYPPPGRPLTADTAFVYVYRAANGPAQAQPILLNDHLIGQLRPGQYLEIMWPHFGNAMRLSMGTAGGPTLLAVPNTTTTNYVKLQAGPALSPWQWMPTAQGEAEVDALEKHP